MAVQGLTLEDIEIEPSAEAAIAAACKGVAA